MLEQQSVVINPNALLERQLINEYLHSRGYRIEDLRKMPEKVVRYLMTEASKYASLKMAEIEAKASWVRKIRTQGLFK